MDPLVSERAMSFAEPPIYSSRDFVTVQTSERPSEPGRWWPAGSRFSVSLRNIAQNELIDVNTMSLQFSVVSVVQPGSLLAATTTGAATSVLKMSRPQDAAFVLPGAPHFGCPFFSSATVQIPGLGLESFLRNDDESQKMVAARLMCASGSGQFDVSQGRASGFSISGRAYDAGARSVADRASCVWAHGQVTDRGAFTAAPTAGQKAIDIAYEGAMSHYSIPLSLLSHLGNGLSSMLPLAYFASGGDLMNLTFQCAPATSALCNMSVDRADASGAATYYVVDPTLSFTKTQINNPSVLAGIEALYRGVSSLQIAPGISAPMAMVLKDVDYTSAFTSVNSAAGSFQLTIPANEPSMRGVLLGFYNSDIIGGGLTTGSVRADATGVSRGSMWTGKHAFGLQPRLRNLQIRIGSYRVPLDAISDLRFLPASIPGLTANPFLGFPTNPTAELDCLSTRREAQRMYVQGKHIFSPFAATEDAETDALAPFWSSSVSNTRSATVSLLGSAYQGVQSGVTAGDVKVLGGAAATSEADSYPAASAIGPGIFVIPFESIAAVLNHRSDAFALRGIDLRSISSITVSGEILGVSTGGGPGGAPSDLSTSGWTVRAWAGYDREIVVLPGRVDTGAQFSLIPTGSSSIPTSGNPAM